MKILDHKTVTERYQNLGYVLLEDYRASRFLHETKCLKCSYVWSVSPRDIFSNHGCPQCSDRIHFSHEQIKQKLEERGFSLLEGKYQSNKTKLLLRCHKHNMIWRSSWNQIGTGRGCKQCGIDKKLGAKNPAWRGGVTSENEKVRKSTKYKNWRMEVFKRDKFTCKACGENKIYLEAHHIKSFSKHPSLRLVVSNGLTLCTSCHKKTHKEQL